MLSHINSMITINTTTMMMMMMNRSMMMMMNILTIRHKSRGKFKPNLQREETIRVTKVLAGHDKGIKRSEL